MQLSQLRTEVYEGLGEPSDINPSSSATRLNLALNEAQKAVATWKDPNPRFQRRARMRNLLAELYFQAKVISGTTAPSGTVATTTGTIKFSSTYVGANNDRYNGWMVSCGSDRRLITDYAGSAYSATLNASWGTTPSNSAAYKLYKAFYYLLPSSDPFLSSSPAGEHILLPSTNASVYRPEGNFLEVLNIQDIRNGLDLDRGGRTESWISNDTSPGDPREWRRDGMKLVLDKPTNEDIWFKLSYYRLPTEMSEDADTPDLPGMFHYGLVLWGLAWGYRRAGEPKQGYFYNEQFNKFMRTRLNTYEIESEITESRGILRVQDYNSNFGGNE